MHYGACNRCFNFVWLSFFFCVTAQSSAEMPEERYEEANPLGEKLEIAEEFSRTQHVIKPPADVKQTRLHQSHSCLCLVNPVRNVRKVNSSPAWNFFLTALSSNLVAFISWNFSDFSCRSYICLALSGVVQSSRSRSPAWARGLCGRKATLTIWFALYITSEFCHTQHYLTGRATTISDRRYTIRRSPVAVLISTTWISSEATPCLQTLPELLCENSFQNSRIVKNHMKAIIRPLAFATPYIFIC